jgi:hypothetical protein
MDKSDAIAARADEAQRILNSPLFADIFEGIRRAYLSEWEELPTSDTELARDIHRRVKCLADVKASLTACINAGKVLQKEQSLRQKAENMAKRAVNRVYNATGVR